MKLIFIVLGIVLLVAAAVWIGTKFFKLAKDQDNDGIPDKVEDAVEDVKKKATEVKRRVKRVKEELKDVAEEVKDVADAAKGKPRRGRPKKSSSDQANK
jgi:F0F1-type ATP synthase membrane subunit b/b'